MNVKQFIKPTKSKIALTAAALIISAILALDIVPDSTVSDSLFVSLTGPGLYAANILEFENPDAKKCRELYEKPSTNDLFGPTTHSCAPGKTLLVHPLIAKAFIVVILLCYWYILSCIFTQLVSFIKKDSKLSPR